MKPWVYMIASGSFPLNVYWRCKLCTWRNTIEMQTQKVTRNGGPIWPLQTHLDFMDAAESVPVEELHEVRHGAGSRHLMEGLHSLHLLLLIDGAHRVPLLQILLTVRRDLQRAARNGLVQPVGLEEKLLAWLLEQTLAGQVQNIALKSHLKDCITCHQVEVRSVFYKRRCSQTGANAYWCVVRSRLLKVCGRGVGSAKGDWTVEFGPGMNRGPHASPTRPWTSMKSWSERLSFVAK